MNYDQIGEFLEHHGLDDDQIDDYFEHHGVKGQKWGVRRAQRKEARERNRELNKSSREADTAQHRANIDKARAKFDSGRARRDWKKAKQQYHVDKANLGSREAKKILNKKRAKLNTDYNTAMQTRDGKELATSMLLAGAGAIAVGLLTSR